MFQKPVVFQLFHKMAESDDPIDFDELFAMPVEYQELVRAVRAGDVRAVQKCLAEHANIKINESDTDGSKPCYFLEGDKCAAGLQARLDIAVLMAKAGCTGSLSVVLAEGVKHGDVDFVKKCLAANAKPSYLYNCSLWLATDDCKEDIPTRLKIAVLIEEAAQGGPINSVLCWAAGKGDLATVKECLAAKRNLDVNSNTQVGGSNTHPPLCHAVFGVGRDRPVIRADSPEEATQLQIVRTLIEHKADLNRGGTNDWTPLFLIMTPNVAKMLIEAKANVNAQDHMHYTPLFHACMGGRVEVVRVLLDHGAKPDMKNYAGETCLDWLVSESREDNGAVVQCRELIQAAIDRANATATTAGSAPGQPSASAAASSTA